MSGADLTALLPLGLLAVTAVALLLQIAARRSHAVAAGITLTGLALALASLGAAAGVAPRQAGPLLVVDGFTLLYAGLLIAGALAVAALSYGYLRGLAADPEEYYLLIVLATLGTVVLAASTHLVSFFLGLETLSVALYTLIAYRRDSAAAIEAGLKYLILAGLSSAFLLFGMALIYADAGTMQLFELARQLGTGAAWNAWIGTGVALVLAGAGFKLAAAPFHLWTPDVYQGAPAPVTGFIATVSKAGMLALLLRWLLALGGLEHSAVVAAVAILAIASMFVGNLLALLQSSLKRLLAYSSIAHMGYMLVGLLAGGALAAEAVTFYLAAYLVTTLAAFGVIAVLSAKSGDRDELVDYHGLFWRHPWLAALLAAALFSLAGIPLTAGFVGKYYVVVAGVEATLWVPVLLLVVNSVIGAFYYLRVLVAMYSAREEGPGAPSLSLAGGLALAALALLLLWIGILPTTLIDLITPAVSALG